MTNHPEAFKTISERMGGYATDAPGVMGAFMKLHELSGEAGALDAKTKELLALAIAIAIRCEGCITFHVHDALALGATRDEIVEVVGVAVCMGGGPSVVYGTEALQAVDQFGAA
jgi:AhpD family alkylhydroperoxidase